MGRKTQEWRRRKKEMGSHNSGTHRGHFVKNISKDSSLHTHKTEKNNFLYKCNYQVELSEMEKMETVLREY